jgi:predicted permease
VALVDRIQLDGTVFSFTLVICAGTTVLFGLLPAAGRRHARVLRAFVVSQVAVTVILLTGAALVLQSLSRLLSVDTGYQKGQVVAADVLLYEGAADVHAFFRRVHERLRRLPGVHAVGLIQSTPLTGKWTFRERIRDVEVPGNFVAFDYFEAMGIPVLAGRTFTPAEYTAARPMSIVINDVAARLFFPDGDAVGRHLELFGRPREIVGVVKGTRDVRLDTPAEPQWYQPMFFGSSQLVVRTSADPAAFAETLRHELVAADPRVIVKRIEPLDAIVAASVFERRAATQLLSVFAGLALTLALVGLYGVLNFTTVQRRREFGVRAALGAQRRDLVGMVLRQGLTMTIAGVAMGVSASVPLAQALKSFLFEIRAVDPPTLILTSLGLVAVALSACAVPAWRAASVDPSITLRAE